MTAQSAAPAPHSRWFARESVGSLCASHARAAEAIGMLRAAAELHRVRVAATRWRPPLRQRVAALVTRLSLRPQPLPATLALPAGPAVPRRASRKLLARRRRARKRLNQHTQLWMEAAHRYAATLPAECQARRILTALIADGTVALALDALDPLDAMLLSTLRNFHPAALAESLADPALDESRLGGQTLSDWTAGH
jgi:hypothetical protein